VTSANLRFVSDLRIEFISAYYSRSIAFELLCKLVMGKEALIFQRDGKRGMRMRSEVTSWKSSRVICSSGPPFELSNLGLERMLVTLSGSEHNSPFVDESFIRNYCYNDNFLLISALRLMNSDSAPQLELARFDCSAAGSTS
jgi:hypothetical protein